MIVLILFLGVQLMRLDVKARYMPKYQVKRVLKEKGEIETENMGKTGWRNEEFRVITSFQTFKKPVTAMFERY